MTGVPDDVLAQVGVPCHREQSVVPVEQGAITSFVSASHNGNPIYWDEAAQALTDGPIAPATMLSVWFQPLPWEPERTEAAVPLRLHFELKARFGYPEAIMSDNVATYYEPVRPGDALTSEQRLVSVSEEKTTRLGTGRFWVIDVEYRNQRDDLVAVERWTAFGYGADAA
ncbi:MAG: MaoC family dehydratase N-terminal domain-containing protein [Acidimicrobiia bacterium]